MAARLNEKADAMRVRILDLDGSLLEQHGLRSQFEPTVYPLREWGPRIRLACSFGRFRRFEQALSERLAVASAGPVVSLYGSGDFHHVSLALVRRIQTPFNLLVLDNHPDWMRGVPLLHCGTWLDHAARLPQVQRVFHVGGDVDFDNAFYWLAPWRLIENGKIVVIPSVRRYQRGRWKGIETVPLRSQPDAVADDTRIGEVLNCYRDELGRCPLYISVDKDVLTVADAVVNWDSGQLTLGEAQAVLRAAIAAANGKCVGIDILGDWSEVRVQGLLRRAFHVTEHPPLRVVPAEAVAVNDRTNRALLTTVAESVGGLSISA